MINWNIINEAQLAIEDAQEKLIDGVMRVIQDHCGEVLQQLINDKLVSNIEGAIESAIRDAAIEKDAWDEEEGDDKPDERN